MIIAVKVIPNAKEFSVELTANGIKCRIPEKPERGKANTYLLKKLSEIFGARVSLVNGETSSRKTIEVGLSAEEIRKRIEEYHSS